jgi:WD40 repeat protein
VGYECVRILTGHKDGVCSVSFSSDDKKILSGSHDKYFIISQVFPDLESGHRRMRRQMQRISGRNL